MTTRPYIALLALVSIASPYALAQTPQPTDRTAPSAASSPHQRDSTATAAEEMPATTDTEPAAASTPHQQSATGTDASGTRMAKAKHDHMMKKCIAQEHAKDASASTDEIKRTCTNQVKAMSSEPAKKY